MTGGLMQIVAYGAQDVYLTGNPMITYFKTVYRRHTNFAQESIEQTFSGDTRFGSRVSALIGRNGDLLSGVSLEITLPHIIANAEDGRWIDSVGHYLISEVDISIGGQLIDRHYADWLEIWSQLSLPSSKASAYYEMIGTDGDVGLRTPTGNGNLVGTGLNTNTSGNRILYVPLQFWFCRNIGLALPLIALQYHEVKIDVLFNSFENMVFRCDQAPGENLRVRLFADYVFLDTDERRRFAQVSHEYLIEQLQFSGDESYTRDSINIDLVFSHPVKELVWVCRQNTAIFSNQWNNYTTLAAENDDVNIYFVRPTIVGGAALTVQGASAADMLEYKRSIANNMVQTAKLQLNGHDRFGTREGYYFNMDFTRRCHTRIPDSPGINVYSFALRPEDHQPSGTCNFSRIDNARLVLTLSPYIDETDEYNGVVKVFATNYNVLRIMSGMGGLAYSN